MNLPDGASMERTDALTRRAEAFVGKLPGVKRVITMGGLNLMTSAYTSNNASLIVMLDPWEERTSRETQLQTILMRTQRELLTYPEALCIPFIPPPIPGLGNAGGFQFELQDRASHTPDELMQTAQAFLAAAQGRPELQNLYSGFRTTVPQIKLDIDRDKARTLGVPIDQVFQSLQVYLGGLQVNDFNRFGRTYKVIIQAEPDFRTGPESIDQIYVRTGVNAMVPLSTLSTRSDTSGPDLVPRYNMYRTAEISGSAAPGFSSGQALAVMEELARTHLPQGYGFEWTNIAFQEKESGGAQGLIFGMAILFVFLFLAAQYESWSIPFSVLFGIPLGVFGAFLGVWLMGLVNNVYVQIGLVMLIGLAAKNAILIVEFAKERYEKMGMPLEEASVEGARLRFRPILMTSFAFILGVVPLVLASGAGAASRVSLGAAVFAGMTAATALGVFFIPLLYVLVQGLANRFGAKSKKAAAASPEAGAEGGRS
jgi:HAE1 family hydrophobic/amphiphilic exporter-1/multidrug efflux pump